MYTVLVCCSCKEAFLWKQLFLLQQSLRCTADGYFMESTNNIKQEISAAVVAAVEAVPVQAVPARQAVENKSEK